MYGGVFIVLPSLCLHSLTYQQDGVTPLFIASENGHSAIVETLIKCGGNPNTAKNVSQLSYLIPSLFTALFVKAVLHSYLCQNI